MKLFAKMKRQMGYWTYERCCEEAKEYNTLKEFRENSPSAYVASKRNGWVDCFTFLNRDRIKRGTWQNYDNCYNEAKKYKTRSEFQKKCVSAYQVALKNGWLDDYTWFETLWEKKWDYEGCYNEALMCKSRSDFKQNNPCAYLSARVNKWLDDYYWLKDERFDLIKDKIDCVYCYEFIEQKSVYIGRTLMKRIEKRDKEHLFQFDSVSNFAKENQVPVPRMKILESNLTINEGSIKEGEYVEKYKNEGWNILNKAKTGSIGKIAIIRWTREKCYEIAKTCTYKSEMKYKCDSAYRAALKHGWINDYEWLETNTSKIISEKLRVWTKEKCKEEALRYKSSSDFKKGNKSAYNAAKRYKWLKDYTWFNNKN